MDSGANGSAGEASSTSREKHWILLSEGVTVDELKKYRKKRSQYQARQDNIRLGSGSLKACKTEYKRAFKPIYNLEPTFRFGQKESSISLPLDNQMEFTTEKKEMFVPFKNVSRPRPVRKPTALKLEGDFLTDTETRRHFVPHEKLEKVRPAQRSPVLRLEGVFESLTSEQKEKYIAFLECKRRVLEKRRTNLHLEGDLDLLTEKLLKYVPHRNVERPPMRKRSTSLKLIGELDFAPEYASNFVDFPRNRPSLRKPFDNIQYEGDFSALSETKANFKSLTDLPKPTKIYRPQSHLRPEGNFQNRSESRTQFIAFDHQPLSSSRTKREDNIRVEGDLDLTPEYRERFCYPKTIPKLEKFHHPETHLKTGGKFESLTEKQEVFKNFGPIQRTVSKRIPENLKLEGDFQKEAEYRRQFVEHPIKVERTPKPLDSLNFQSFQVVNCKNLLDAPALPPEPLRPVSPMASSPSPSRPKFRMDVENVDKERMGFGKNRQTEERFFGDENGNNKAFTVLGNKPNAQAELRQQNNSWIEGYNRPI